MKKEPNYAIGFTTTKGVMFDIDNISKGGIIKSAEFYLEQYKLEGYIILQTGKKKFHVIFNKYISWRKTMMIIFSNYKAISWGVYQAAKGELTLRVTNKPKSSIPILIVQTGKHDKLIKEYVEIFNLFNKEKNLIYSNGIIIQDE